MLSYTIKRLLSIVPIVLGVSLLVFLTLYLMPGDPAVNLLGPAATEERLVEIRKELGLEEPFLTQYGIWLTNLVKGDMGTSISMRMPVTDIVFSKFANTLILAAGSLIICFFGGVLIGILAGLRQYSWFDRASMFLAQFGANVPVFWLAIVLMWIFALQLGLLPSSGMYDLRGERNLFSLIEHLVLPAVATATVSLSVIARSTRGRIIAVLHSDFIKTFRAIGIPEWLIIIKHVLRNILSSLINITGLQAGYLLGGAIFVEVVFSWPGLGSQLYDSIVSKDIPVIQGGVLLISFSFVLINMISDLAVAFLNPKLRN